MSEPQLADPIPQSQDPASSPNAGSVPRDPLLDGGAYIDPDRTDSGAESAQNQDPAGNPEFEPGVVIAAEPISMYIPEERSAEATPRSARRRNADEMSKRPSWLPDDWKIDLRVRSSGATAGLIDRYYVEPSGQRRFRSKNEVCHFLETGSKPKRKPTSETTDAGPSGSPASAKQKKSGAKRKKSEALKTDSTHPPRVNGVRADTV